MLWFDEGEKQQEIRRRGRFHYASLFELHAINVLKIIKQGIILVRYGTINKVLDDHSRSKFYMK